MGVVAGKQINLNPFSIATDIIYNYAEKATDTI